MKQTCPTAVPGGLLRKPRCERGRSLVRALAAGLALAALGGAAWRIASTAPAAAEKPEEPEGPRLEFTRRPLGEVVAAVSARAGFPIAFRMAGLAEREVTLNLPDTKDAGLLMRRFGEALDRWDLAVVRDPEPARSWSILAFHRIAPTVPAGDAGSLVVRVVAGRVRLEGGGQAVELCAGEEGGVGSDGRLAAARRIDPAGVAAWRTGAVPVPSEARPPAAAAFAWRVIGTTEDGRSVVEWGPPGETPQRGVLEKGAKEFRVPLTD